MACVNACSKSCITMQPGELGHLYPVVDTESCNECGLCRRVCPVNNPRPLSVAPMAYAGWHRDYEQYHSCSSGGVATALSQKIIEDGGCVYGCANLPGLEIKHIRVNTMAGLERLKGSKYVQSYIGHIYKAIKKDVQQGLKVLFVGTPCQVGGLKNFLGKEYETLYTIDLICHGVPSQAVLEHHIRKVWTDAERIEFRKGNDMGLRVFDASDKLVYYSNVWYERYQDTYYNTFIDGYTYRNSCYTCPYARKERCSDITIGDFWGIGSDFQYDKVNGCSCILPITEKGKKLLNASNLELYLRTVEEVVSGNGQLRHPVEKKFRRRLFRHLAPIWGIGGAYRFCELDHIINKRLIQRIKNKLFK